MAKFITGEDLEDAVCEIIWGAEINLLIVSPYIKLDDYFKKLFDKHVNNHQLHILIVFGKNEGEVRKSLSQNDIEYFKKFLNVSIVYLPNLHGKYYGNEKKGVITSINLYDYSFKNNIEFGVYSEGSLLNRFSNSADVDAWQTCYSLAEDGEVIFIKRPVYEKKMLSVLLGKNYVKSDVLYDKTDSYYSFSGRKLSKEIKVLGDFPDEVEMGSQQSRRPTRNEVETEVTGYCIRTGDKIPFDINRPLSGKAFKTWAAFGDDDYPEKYCHKTGNKSFGRTSMRNPIL